MAKLFRNNRGSVFVEFAIILPLILYLTFGCFQLAMLFVADSVMEYAAFNSARCYMVQISDSSQSLDDANEVAKEAAVKSAAMITSLISFFDEDGLPIEIPGWGKLKFSTYSQNHTWIRVMVDGERVLETGSNSFQRNVSSAEEIEVTVFFEYKPMFPLMTLPALGINDAVIETRNDGTILLEKSCRMVTSL